MVKLEPPILSNEDRFPEYAAVRNRVDASRTKVAELVDLSEGGYVTVYNYYDKDGKEIMYRCSASRKSPFVIYQRQHNKNKIYKHADTFMYTHDNKDITMEDYDADGTVDYIEKYERDGDRRREIEHLNDPNHPVLDFFIKMLSYITH